MRSVHYQGHLGAALLLLAAASAGCGEDAPVAFGDAADDASADIAADAKPVDATGGDAKADSAAPSDAAPPSDADAAAPPDAPDDDTSGPCSAADCPCTTSADCDSGHCALDAAGDLVCAAACDDGCPDGQVCGVLDGAPACVTPALTLCQPCTTDAFCRSAGDPGALCVPRGGDGAFCGASCGPDAPCPDGYACEEVTSSDGEAGPTCVLTDPADSCACTAWGLAAGATTPCHAAAGPLCPATRGCAAAPDDPDDPPVLTACGAWATEICNGLDDDCDGTTDEGCDGDDDGYCALGALVAPGATCQPGDCDDADPAVHPDATELPGDGDDQDCDGLELCHVDADQDGYRTDALVTSPALACPTSEGLATPSAPLDCFDADAAIHPGATELSDDGKDADCDLVELFDGLPLALDAPLTGDTLSVTASGTFPLPPFGDVPVTASLTRAAPGLPISWCLSGPVAADFEAFAIDSATATLCYADGAASPTLALTGLATAGGVSWPVTGTASRTAPYDLTLAPTGTVTLRGHDLTVDPALSALAVTDGQASWTLVATHDALPLGADLSLSSAVVTLDPSGIDVSGQLTVGAGAQAITFDAAGPYPAAGPFTLALTSASTARFRPFTLDQHPLATEAISPVGVLTVDAAGAAAATFTSAHLCSGTCCAPSPNGGCDNAKMSDCVTAAVPACALEWTQACVDALVGCPLALATAYAIDQAKVTVTIDAADPWAPVLTGIPTATGWDGFDLPDMLATSRVDTCRDPHIRACACDSDAACCAGAWSAACDATVLASCGGAKAAALCGDGSLFMHAAPVTLWSPDVPGALDGMFTLRDPVFDTYFAATTDATGAPAGPADDPGSYLPHIIAAADAVVCLAPPCPADFVEGAGVGDIEPDHAGKVVRARGHLGLDAQYITAAIGPITIPPFEAQAGAALIASLTSLPTDGSGVFDVFGTPDDPHDDIAIPTGLSVALYGNPAIPIPDLSGDEVTPTFVAVATFDPLPPKFTLYAEGRFDWTVVPPKLFPGLQHIKLSKLRAYGSFDLLPQILKAVFKAPVNALKNAFGKDASGGNPYSGIMFGIEGSAELQLTTQEAPAYGKAAFEFKPDPKKGGIVGGNVWVEGKLIEPFYMKDFAYDGVGLTVFVNMNTGLPLSLGLSMATHNKGFDCEWPDPALDWHETDTCLTTMIEHKLYKPWLDLVLWWELNDFGINSYVGAINSLLKTAVGLFNLALEEAADPTLVWTEIVDGMATQLTGLDLGEVAGSIPPIPEIPAIPKIPYFDFEIEKARFFFAPKAVSQWGRSFKPGISIDGEVEIMGGWSARLAAYVDFVGLLVPHTLHQELRVSEMDLGFLRIGGDPYDDHAALAGGSVALPPSALLAPVALTDETGTHVRRTVEAHVVKAAWADGEAALLYDDSDGTGGLTIALAKLGASEVIEPLSQYPLLDLETSTDFDSDGEDPGAELAWVVVTLRDGGLTRTLRTVRGVADTTDWTHVAVSLRGGAGIAVVDGVAHNLLPDDGAADIGLGATTAGATVGLGFDAIDEVRIWRTFRTSSELQRNRRFLAIGDSQSPDLLARYAFDWDAGGSVVHNSRHHAGDALHGSFTGAAHAAPSPPGDAFLRTSATLVAMPPEFSAELRSGVELDLPLFGLAMGFSQWLYLDTTTLQFSGEYYQRAMSLLDFGPLGSLWFTGNGPNGVQGDFDDGLFGGVQLESATLSASGRVEWRGGPTGDSTIASGAFFVGCPPGQTCAGLDQYTLTVDGAIDWNLPFGVRVAGAMHFEPWQLTVDGEVSVGGIVLASQSIAIDEAGIAFASFIDLPVIFDHDLGQATLSFTVDFATGKTCGHGDVVVNPPVIDETFSCKVGVCIDGGGLEVTEFDCFTRCWVDAMCGDGEFCDALGKCWPKRPLGEQCAGVLAGDHECLSGFCDPWVAFPIAICAEPLDDGIGCLQDGQCISGACGYRPGNLQKRCYTPGGATLGEECFDVLHCGLGECWGTATWGAQCLCTTNEQCQQVAPGTVCKTGDWGITPESGLCIAPRLAGQWCDATSECAAGLVCGTSGKCVTPATRHNWEECEADEQCISGECWGWVCRCTSHGDCHADLGADSYCDMGPWLAGNEEGKCHSPKQPSNVAAYCEDGGWCESGLCTFSGRQNKNICYTVLALPEGSTCDIHEHCASGICDPGQGYKCAPMPSSKGNWQACTASNQCIGGECWNGLCRCTSHSDCHAEHGSNSYCDMGSWTVDNQEGRCHTPKVTSNTSSWCEDDGWCQSNMCVYSGKLVHNTCATYQNLPNDSPCDVHQQCASGNCVYWFLSGYYCSP